MPRRIRTVFSLLVTALPRKPKIWVLNNILGHKIDKTAIVGISYINVERLIMGEGAKIGHLNIIKNLKTLELESHATIGSRNYISCLPLGSTRNFGSENNRNPSLHICEHASITGRHNLDCNNMITIGKYTIVAGLGSTFLTHGINIYQNKQETCEISIGDYCMVGSNCVLLKGSSLPSFSVLAAGSVLSKNQEKTHFLYSGVPATPVKHLPEDAPYFSRTVGFVS